MIGVDAIQVNAQAKPTKCDVCKVNFVCCFPICETVKKFFQKIDCCRCSSRVSFSFDITTFMLLTLFSFFRLVEYEGWNATVLEQKIAIVCKVIPTQYRPEVKIELFLNKYVFAMNNNYNNNHVVAVRYVGEIFWQN
jgi:hypothetical protein